MSRRRGQSTLEYVIILSAVVLALLAGRTVIQTSVNKSVTDTATALTTATAKLPGVTNVTQ